MVRRATTPLTLTFTGTVPATTERTDLPGPRSSFIANRFPFATTLGGLGLQNLPNWQAGASASQADQVLLWNGTGWDGYFFNGTNWRRGGSFANFNTQPILPGAALFIVRQSSATGDASTLIQSLPYYLQ